MAAFKDRVVRLFKINTPKQTLWERDRKETKQIKNRNNQSKTIKNIKNLFILKKEKEIKDRDIRTLFGQEDHYYKLKRKNNF